MVPKFLFVTLLFALITLQLDDTMMAEEPVRNPIPIFVPTDKFDLWGLIDHGGNLVIPPKYRAIWSFRKVPGGKAIALVRGIDSKYGYIDATGREIHPPTLEDAFQFSDDGVARFKQDGKFGFMGLDGKPVISPQYDFARGMTSERALVLKNDKGFYIDKTGQVAIPGPFVGAKPFGRNGLAEAAVEKKRNAWGYIDTDGKWVIKPAFEETTPFSDNGRAAVATFAKSELNPLAKPELRWGVIDESGKWIVKPKYESLEAFNARGYAEFKPSGDDWWPMKRGLLNDRGEELFILKHGSLTIEKYCDLVRGDYSPGWAPYDFEGNPVESLSKKIFKWLGPFDKTKQALAFRKEKWGRVSPDGKFSQWPDEVQEPYVDYSKYDGSSIVNVDGRDGELIPVVLKGGRLGYVNAENQLVYLADFEGSPNADTLVFKRSNGTEIWRHRFKDTKLVECRSFFTPSDFKTGFKAEYLTNIQKSVDKLIAAKPTWFEFSVVMHDADGVYEVEEEDREDASFGAINVLGSHYVNEFDFSYFGDFMTGNHDLDDRYESVKKQLVAKYGKPLDLTGDENEHAKKLRDLQQFAGSDDTYWNLGAGYLGLLYLADSGDGDFGVDLILLYLPKQRP